MVVKYWFHPSKQYLCKHTWSIRTVIPGVEGEIDVMWQPTQRKQDRQKHPLFLLSSESFWILVNSVGEVTPNTWCIIRAFFTAWTNGKTHQTWKTRHICRKMSYLLSSLISTTRWRYNRGKWVLTPIYFVAYSKTLYPHVHWNVLRQHTLPPVSSHFLLLSIFLRSRPQFSFFWLLA